MPCSPSVGTPFFQCSSESSASTGIGRSQIQIQLSAKSAAAFARSSQRASRDDS